MNMKEIKEMAKNLGIKPGRLRKMELIRLIQKTEGNIPCFATERVNHCNERNCLWYEDCLKYFTLKIE